MTYLDSDGNPIITTAGYTIMKREYYRDGAEKSKGYFGASGNLVSLKKRQVWNPVCWRDFTISEPER